MDFIFRANKFRPWVEDSVDEWYDKDICKFSREAFVLFMLAIIAAESGFAIAPADNFEENYYPKYIVNNTVVKKELDALRIPHKLAATAVGNMQIIVQTARGLGWEGNVKKVSELRKPKENIRWGGAYLYEKMLKYPKPHDVFSTYNAGRVYTHINDDGIEQYNNQEYVDKVRKFYHMFRKNEDEIKKNVRAKINNIGGDNHGTITARTKTDISELTK